MSDDPDDRFEQRSDLWSSELDEDDPDDMDTKDGQRPEDTMDATSDQHPADDMDTDDPKRTTEWDVDSIREAWNPNSIRLPDSIQKPFDKQHKHVDLDLEDVDTDIKYTKDRYYKPLVIALGIQQLRSLEAEEIATLLEEMEQANLLDD